MCRWCRHHRTRHRRQAGPTHQVRPCSRSAKTARIRASRIRNQGSTRRSRWKRFASKVSCKRCTHATVEPALWLTWQSLLLSASQLPHLSSRDIPNSIFAQSTQASFLASFTPGVIQTLHRSYADCAVEATPSVPAPAQSFGCTVRQSLAGLRSQTLQVSVHCCAARGSRGQHHRIVSRTCMQPGVR